MKTPVVPEPETDRANLEVAFASYGPFESRKFFPNSDIELEKPSTYDVVGLIITIAACLGIVWLAVFVASLGA